MSKIEAGLYGSGFERGDWYLLKEVLILHSKEDTRAAFSRLPKHLQGSSVGMAISNYLATGEQEQLDHAISLMAPGMGEVFLLLEKA